MLKRLLFFLLRLYLWPLEQNKRIALYARSHILQLSAHFHAAVDLIKKREQLTSGEIVLDIGAFEGSTTAFFAAQFPQMKVLGFEPLPDMYRKAADRCRHLPNVHLENKALDKAAGEATLFVTDNGVSSSLNPVSEQRSGRFSLQREIKVPVTTLDDYFRNGEMILLMKIDTQGRELSVLQGGLQVLKRTKYILVEMNNHRDYEGTAQYYEVDAFLREQGFRLISLTADHSYEGLAEYDAIYTSC